MQDRKQHRLHQIGTLRQIRYLLLPYRPVCCALLRPDAVMCLFGKLEHVLLAECYVNEFGSSTFFTRRALTAIHRKVAAWAKNTRPKTSKTGTRNSVANSTTR
jgi:hypothetical protein